MQKIIENLENLKKFVSENAQKFLEDNNLTLNQACYKENSQVCIEYICENSEHIFNLHLFKITLYRLPYKNNSQDLAINIENYLFSTPDYIIKAAENMNIPVPPTNCKFQIADFIDRVDNLILYIKENF